LDDCAVLIVADTLKREGISAHAAAATAMEDHEAASICLCYIENVSKAQLDYTLRKLSRKAPKTRIVVCLLANDEQISAPGQDGQPSRSLKATVATLANPKVVAQAMLERMSSSEVQAWISP
jgi:hypothetical protein